MYFMLLISDFMDIWSLQTLHVPRQYSCGGMCNILWLVFRMQMKYIYILKTKWTFEIHIHNHVDWNTVLLYILDIQAVCPGFTHKRQAYWYMHNRSDSRFAPSQWETVLLCNDVSHWLSRSDSRFAPSQWETALLCNDVSHWLAVSLLVH